jgi:2-iminobutanoate/2-iminopropanoate deaminase
LQQYRSDESSKELKYNTTIKLSNVTESGGAHMLKKVSTDKAPAAIGPYSQGIIAGDMLFASGQIPIDPSTGDIKGSDIIEQAEQVMKNVGAILEEVNTDYTKVVKTTCFLADMADFAAFNGVYEKYFTEKPARSCVAAKQLPKNVLCEVEVIAYLG